MLGLWAPKRVIHHIHLTSLLRSRLSGCHATLPERLTFDRPETIRDRAKMNLAGHRDRRLSENYFEPCWTIKFQTNTSPSLTESDLPEEKDWC